MSVRPGCESLFEEARGLVAGRRYAICVHGASVDSRGRYVFQRLCSDPLTRPQFLLVPEHGLFGEHAYMEPVPHSVDPYLGVPVISLYGDSFNSLRPSSSLVASVDAIIFDLQDIGTRFYTYLSTMAMLMETCAQTGTQFVICDRPNPIGLQIVEGGGVRPHLRSFVGYLDVPVRHGLTAGEAARLHLAKQKLDLDLIILECAGLRRQILWPDFRLPFVPPSPNIPDFDTALLYPGMCLLEGTNVSEGRGTTMPFKVFGAPFIKNPFALAEHLTKLHLPAVSFRPLFFTPRADKWASHRCGGVQVIPLDPLAYRPFLIGLCVLSALMTFRPDGFAYRTDSYEFVQDRLAIDLLLGDESLRYALEHGEDPRDIYASLESYEKEFREQRQPFLLYEN